MAEKDKIKGISLKIGGDTSGLSKSLADINTKSRDLQADLKTVDRLLKLDPTNVTLTSQKHDLLKKSVEAASEKLDALRKSEESVQKAFDDGTIDQTEFIAFQKELVNAKNNLEKLQKQEGEAESSASELGKETKNTKDDIKDLGDQSLKSGDILKESLKAEAIVSGLKAIGGAVKDVSKAAVQVGSDFESSMSRVAATMGMTSDDVNNGSKEYTMLEKAAADAGATTKYTASEAADALNYLALAGYDAEKSVSTLPKVLTLAQAGEMDLATTSDLVTDSMGALQLGIDKLDSYVDQLAKTSQKSNTNVQQLGEGILVVAGTSVSTGQNIEKINTALGILTNNGMKGAEGGTKLRNILLSLTAPTDKASDKIKDLGLSVSDSAGNIRDIDDIMGDLNNLLKDMSESEKTEVLNTIFNKSDLSGVSALLESTNGEFESLYQNIVDSTGAASEMANTMNDNLNGRLAEVNSALEAIGVAAYKKFEKPLKDSAKKASTEFVKFADSIEDGELSDSFENLGDSFEEFVEVGIDAAEFLIPPLTTGLSWILDNSNLIIGGLTGIGAAMITQKAVNTVLDVVDGYRKFKKAVEAAETAQATFNAVSAATPWGAIATVAGLAIGAIATYALTSDDTSESVDNLTSKQKDLIEKTQDFHEELAKNEETRKNNAENLDTTYKSYDNMVNKLYELNDVEELSAGQKEQMKGMVDELNKAMPELNLQLDEETGHLKNQKQAVVELIEKSKEKLKLEAVKEDLITLYKEQATAEKQEALAKQEYLDLKEKEIQLEKEVKKAWKESAKAGNNRNWEERTSLMCNLNSEATKTYNHAVTLQSEYNKTKNSVEKLNDAWKTSKNDLKAVNKQVEESEDYINGLAETISESAETTEVASDKLTITVGKYKDQTVEVASSAISEIETMEQEYQEFYDKKKTDLYNALDIFKEFSINSEVTADSLIKNLESNLDGISNWADGLNTLAKRGLDAGLIQKLRDAGPSSASEVAAMTSMTDEQLSKYNETWQKYTGKIEGIVSKEMQDAKTEINKKIDEAINDANQKVPEAASAGSNVGTAIGENFKKSYDASNPKGHIENDLNNIYNALSDYENMLSIGFYGTGQFISQGLGAGIIDNTQYATYGTEVLASSVLYTGRKSFGINSPSKKFYEIGDYCIQGQVNAMKDKSIDLYNQIDNINRNVLDRSQNVQLGYDLEVANASARGLINSSIAPSTYNSNSISSSGGYKAYGDKISFNITFSDVKINGDNDLEDIAEKLMAIMKEKISRRGAVYS